MAVVRRVSPASRGLAPEQLHVLVQQQQRILRRSMVIACAVKADALDPPTLTIGELLHFARLL